MNPRTNRAVRVGSPTWVTLVKEGVIEDTRLTEKNDKVLYSIEEDDTDATVKSKIDEINEQLPLNTQAVRGRGKYAGKIVKRSKPINTEEMARHAIKATAKKIKDIDVYEGLKETEKFEESLEELIMRDLGLMRFEKEKEKEADDTFDLDLPEDDDEDLDEECLLSSDSELDLYCDEEFDLPEGGQSDTHLGDEEFNWDEEPETTCPDIASTTECEYEDEDCDN